MGDEKQMREQVKGDGQPTFGSWIMTIIIIKIIIIIIIFNDNDDDDDDDDDDAWGAIEKQRLGQ